MLGVKDCDYLKQEYFIKSFVIPEPKMTKIQETPFNAEKIIHKFYLG